MTGGHKNRGEKVLVGPWRRVHAIIWLVGLAILAWQDWWWPGILVLVALSILAEIIIEQIPGAAAPEEESAAPDLVELRARPQEPDPTKLPEKCPQCGAPVPVTEVRWTSATTVSCPYCGATLRLRE
jgi:ribosomal protein S27E